MVSLGNQRGVLQMMRVTSPRAILILSGRHRRCFEKVQQHPMQIENKNKRRPGHGGPAHAFSRIMCTGWHFDRWCRACAQSGTVCRSTCSNFCLKCPENAQARRQKISRLKAVGRPRQTRRGTSSSSARQHLPAPRPPTEKYPFPENPPPSRRKNFTGIFY